MRSESSSRAAVPLAVLTMLFGALWVGSCNAYEPPPDTGGVTLGSGLCGALTVVAVDDSYASSSVAVLGFDGSVESASIVSAASKKVGLSAALSGDVALPTAPTRAPHFVLIDRTASALLWIDAERGKVEGQLSVQFPRGGVAKNANPQDYVETSAHKAYVSRYTDNPEPGKEAFDGGGDLLILDPSKRELVGRIDLHAAFAGDDPSIEPRPGRMIVADGHLYVLCAALSQSFKKNGDSKLVDIDLATDEIVGTTTLVGSDNCLGLALSPSGKRLAVTCPGPFQGELDSDITRSALIVLDRTQGLAVVSRLPASTFGQNPLGFSVAFATDDLVLFPTAGCSDFCRSSVPRHDALVLTTVDGQQHSILLESDKQAISLSDVRCENTCGACFATDAERGVIDRFPIEALGLGAPTRISLRDKIGQPPRYLGSIGSPSP